MLTNVLPKDICLNVVIYYAFNKKQTQINNHRVLQCFTRYTYLCPIYRTKKLLLFGYILVTSLFATEIAQTGLRHNFGLDFCTITHFHIYWSYIRYGAKDYDRCDVVFLHTLLPCIRLFLPMTHQVCRRDRSEMNFRLENIEHAQRALFYQLLPHSPHNICSWFRIFIRSDICSPPFHPSTRPIINIVLFSLFTFFCILFVRPLFVSYYYCIIYEMRYDYSTTFGVTGCCKYCFDAYTR